MFSVGEKIVHPLHGAGEITGFEVHDFVGAAHEYYVIELVCKNERMMVPVKTAKELGVRRIICEEEAERVLALLEQPCKDSNPNWNQRYKENMDRLRTGNIDDVAYVIRDLSGREHKKGLSSREKKMLTSAIRILVSEMACVLKSDFDSTRNMLKDVLASNS